MGFFSFSKSSRNVILVHTDKKRYFSGEKVSGTVTLHIIDPITLNAVYLKVKGLQKVKFTHVSIDPNSRSETEYSQKGYYFRDKYCLYAPPNSKIGKCQLTLPFEFTLSGGLAPSCFVKNSKPNFETRVMYKLKAEGNISGLFTSHLKHTQEIIIKEPPLEIVKSLHNQVEENMSYCWCLNRGNVSVAAFADKNDYGPGDVPMLRVTVDSQECQVDLKGIMISLRRHAYAITDLKGEYFAKDIVTCKTAPVKAGEKIDRTIPLRLPASLEPSCTTHLLSCLYLLTVTVAVPWASDVIVALPVHIHSSKAEEHSADAQSPRNASGEIRPTAHIQALNFSKY